MFQELHDETPAAGRRPCQGDGPQGQGCPGKQAVVEAEGAREKSIPHVARNSGENEWYTPREYIEAAVAVMGGIDCDPASSEIANRTVRATRYYTKEDDGLKLPWGRRVWLNPPYARSLVTKFSKAMIEKFEKGEVGETCILVNNATETRWFQDLLSVATCVCFVRRRVRILDPDGNPGAPLQGQAVIYLGPKAVRFSEAFAAFGPVLVCPPRRRQIKNCPN